MRYPVRPIPFAAALILAPLLPALPALPIQVWGHSAPAGLMIVGAFGMGALVFGIWSYATIGAVAFWWALRRRSALPAAVVGLLTHIVSLHAVFAVGVALGIVQVPDRAGFMAFYACFGVVFSLLWGGLFGLLYRAFSRNIRRTPV